MMNPLRIALAQINPTVGNLAGNLELAESAVSEALRQRADLVVFPELSVTGYPPKDLLSIPAFLRSVSMSS